jgi:uncharacterized protein YegP (UPF0339 family)
MCIVPILAGLLGLAAGDARSQDTGKMKFELYKDRGGEFRWRLMAPKGDVLATPGQGYKEKADARRGIELVQKAGTDSKMTFETYEDAKKETRWRLKAANGQVVATSGVGYKGKADAEKAIDQVKAGAPKAEVAEVKE